MSDFIPAFGRIEDFDAVEKVFSKQSDPFIATAASIIMSMADDNADVDLCANYEVTTGRKWNSRNQNPRGFCVGFGNAKMASLAVAGAAEAGEITEPGADVAIEPIYGGMRFEVGAKLYNSSLYRGGDGGVGSWAAEWLTTVGGILLMKPYGGIDLTNYDMNRCSTYGNKGCPDELEPTARLFPFKQMALAETAEQCWALIGQLHPLVHCSNQGFSMQRSADGTCRDNDTWPHCAGWSGRFTLKNGTRVLRYENSWNGTEDGRGYLGNPVVIEGMNGPIKLNGNQFLVPLSVVDRMCKRGRETYSISGPMGFTVRRPTLLI